MLANMPFNEGFLATFLGNILADLVGKLVMSGVPGRGSGARARRRRGTSGLGCLPPHSPHLELGVATRRSPAGVVFNVFMQNAVLNVI